MSKTANISEGFHRKLDSIIEHHRRGAGGIRTAQALTERLDTLVGQVFGTLESTASSLLTIVALGGYGRRELCFSSDVDIMILVQNNRAKERATPMTEQFLHTLLDVGLDIGHSYRTINECLEFSEGELETWLSLLEARYIYGNRATYGAFNSKIATKLKSSNKTAFVSQVDAITAQRHDKYGDSTTLLEPNIKNSSGGLRDLHTLLWLSRGLGEDKRTTLKKESVLAALLRSNRLKRVLGQEVVQNAVSAFDFDELIASGL